MEIETPVSFRLYSVCKEQNSKEHEHLSYKAVYLDFVQGPSLAIQKQCVSEMGYNPVFKWKEYGETVECLVQLVERITCPGVFSQGPQNSLQFLHNIST
jgi:hypothetical protein